MTSHEIRICNRCGLRYPRTAEHPFGVRCPDCLGETRIVLRTEVNQLAPRGRTGSAAEFGKISPSKRTISVALDNIRSAWNVGSVLRSADGFGFSHAYLCGISPTPELQAVKKTALGADEFVSWSYHKDALRLILSLQGEGFKIWALEDDHRATSLDTAAGSEQKDGEKVVLIVGSEVSGVDPGLLGLCDRIFHIPMQGTKRSFNVAVAFGIAAYALTTPGQAQY